MSTSVEIVYVCLMIGTVAPHFSVLSPSTPTYVIAHSTAYTSTKKGVKMADNSKL